MVAIELHYGYIHVLLENKASSTVKFVAETVYHELSDRSCLSQIPTELLHITEDFSLYVSLITQCL